MASEASGVPGVGDQQFQMLMSQLADIRSLITAQNGKIDYCIEKISDLKLENDALKAKVIELEDKYENTSVSSIYMECTSRIQREKNVLFYGIEESLDCSEIVSDILADVVPSKPPQYICANRLGEPTKSKIRPVKVEFGSRYDAVSVLRNKNKLDLKRYPNIKIKNDYTRQQRDELTKIYQELTRRTANGEKLKLKFISGQPTIVPNTQKRPREEVESPAKNPPKVNKPGSSKNFK